MKSKILKIGIIGGSIHSTIGKTHMKAISLNKNVFIQCGFFSRRKKVNTLSGKFYNIEPNKIYSSVSTLILKEKKILDAVVILTPPDERYKVIKLFVDAKIAIIAEKPLCSNYKDSQKIYNFLIFNFQTKKAHIH